MGRPMPDQRLAAAYHEAGHAVVGHLFGFWIDERGMYVTPNGLGFCGSRCRREEHTLEAAVAHGLAGWLAEHRHHRRGGALREHGFIDALCDVRQSIDPGDIFDPGDLHGVAGVLLRAYPGTSDGELLSRYRGHVRRTLTLLRRPPVWAAVKRVAHALHERGRLDASVVDELLGDDLDEYRLDP